MAAQDPYRSSDVNNYVAGDRGIIGRTMFRQLQITDYCEHVDEMVCVAYLGLQDSSHSQIAR